MSNSTIMTIAYLYCIERCRHHMPEALSGGACNIMWRRAHRYDTLFNEEVV